MKNTKFKYFIFFFFLFSAQAYTQTINFTIALSDTPKPISPYIYGANPEFTSNENLGARRLGGNRLTGYNWENNASHAGTDWYNNNDDYLTYGLANPNAPGGTIAAFHDEAMTVSAYPLVTLQMAGYVARDKNGTSVTAAETAPSARWNKVQFVKGSAFSLTPNLTDTMVYMDECVNLLLTSFGAANTSNGVKGYALDNEPALWPTTHPRIHPVAPTCSEVVQNGIALSNAVKNVDTSAEIFGPVLYGFGAYYNFQSASDWSTVSSGKGYSWFVDYYLAEMKKAETIYEKRLLDVFDIHWYPEAQGDARISDVNANSTNDKTARLQAPRTLWDSNYKYSASNPKIGEKSWISQWYPTYLPLIPKIKASIDKYYPGTKLAFTEFTYGGENDITGAMATADVLGIFGKYGVYFATFWPGNSNSSYVQAAYRMFRNYDGSKSTFGDFSIPAYTTDSVNTSIYGSVKNSDNTIHVIVINKDLSNSKPANFGIENITSLSGGTAWILDSSSAIRYAGVVTTISGNSFTYTLPAASVCHFVLQTSDTFAHQTPVSNLPLTIDIRPYPNPFNPTCNIQYTVPDRSMYTMMIVDLLGRVIKSYELKSQYGTIRWDGTNQQNQTVASGVYCVIVRGENRQFLSKKIVFLK